MDAALVFLAGLGTAVATGLGAIPVVLLRRSVSVAQPLLAGVAIGVMVVASVVGLLVPALEDGAPPGVVAGLITGAAFVGAARTGLATKRARARIGIDLRPSILVFAVLFAHSLPEGFAIGAAWASDTVGLGLFVLVAIAVQNIPEGTAVAVPLQAAGVSGMKQVGAAVASSLPQPVGAVAAFVLVEQISALLPASLGFAAGAMLTVVAFELVPSAWRGRRLPAAAGAGVGAILMLALGVLLEV